MMENILLRKIENELKQLNELNYDIDIITIDTINNINVPQNNIIDCVNSLIYVFYLSTPDKDTTGTLESFDNIFSFKYEYDGVIRFNSPIQFTDCYLIKYVKIDLIR